MKHYEIYMHLLLVPHGPPRPTGPQVQTSIAGSVLQAHKTVISLLIIPLMQIMQLMMQVMVVMVFQ